MLRRGVPVLRSGTLNGLMRRPQSTANSFSAPLSTSVGVVEEKNVRPINTLPS
jgi:hypothetical protein